MPAPVCVPATATADVEPPDATDRQAGFAPSAAARANARVG
jgi:hypothetical protein